jgi:hypothetical protein
MIDIATEDMVSLTEAAKTLPSRPDQSTLWRWRNRGVRGVRLETVLVGGRRMTSRQALNRFFAAVNAAADGKPVRTETPREREQAISRAERWAAELGI